MRQLWRNIRAAAGDERAVGPHKAALNTGVTLFSIGLNPFAGLLYFGADAFYRDGWPAALERVNQMQRRDREMLGYYPRD